MHDLLQRLANWCLERKKRRKRSDERKREKKKREKERRRKERKMTKGRRKELERGRSRTCKEIFCMYQMFFHLSTILSSSPLLTLSLLFLPSFLPRERKEREKKGKKGRNRGRR